MKCFLSAAPVLRLSTNPETAFCLPRSLAFNLKYIVVLFLFVPTVLILTLQRDYKVSKGQSLEMM